MGDRISFEKTFLLIIRSRLKVCNIIFFENEARLVMFNLTLSVRIFFVVLASLLLSFFINLKFLTPSMISL